MLPSDLSQTPLVATGRKVCKPNQCAISTTPMLATFLPNKSRQGQATDNNLWPILKKSI